MTILYFLSSLLILGLIITMHEFGHFISARLFGIHALEFSIGMGPKIWSRRGAHTLYSLRAIPMGGFCSFEGEDDGQYQSPDALHNQKPWKRFVVIAGGPLMNFVLAFVVLMLFFMVLGVPAVRPEIAEVQPGAVAELARLQAGDIITAVNSEPIEDSEAGAQRVRTLIRESGGQKLSLEVNRLGESHMIDMLVPLPSAEGGAQIGIWLGQARVRIGFVGAVRNALPVMTNMMGQMIDGLKNLVFKGEGLEETSGPIGMLNVMTQEIANGWDQVFFLIIMISLNLGIMNLLPLPALDGGRLVFITIEGITRRKIKPEFEGWVHGAGFLLLIGLMLFISYNDIAKLIAG